MSNLGDDVLALILDRVYDVQDRKSVSLVCKQWLRLEGETRSSIWVLEPDLLHNFLPRFPNLVMLESSKLMNDTHSQFIAQTCPRLVYVNLNLKQPRAGEGSNGFVDGLDFGDVGLAAIANGCPKLTSVSLRRRRNVGNIGVISLVNRAENLTYLDFGRCGLIDDRSLEAIGGLNSIRVLNLEACTLITDRGLGFLATGSCSRTLKKLVLAECDRVTDSGVSLLQGMCCLEDLNLAECGPKVTDHGGMAVAAIPSLKRLNFSWLINLTDITVRAIAEHCKNLLALDLTGCELVTGAGIRAFAGHKSLEKLVLASCYSIYGDIVYVVLQCNSLKSLVLDKRLRMWIPARIQENISRFCKLSWR